MFKCSRNTFHCVCGGLICVLLPAAVVGVVAPFFCKKCKQKKDKQEVQKKAKKK